MKVGVEHPVLLLNFNRPEFTRGLIDNLRAYRPKRVYVSIDGPRQNSLDTERVQQVEVECRRIDWTVDVSYRIQDSNLGLRRNVRESLDWFFDKEDAGIVLEDDIRFSDGFVGYMNRTLRHYRDHDNVGVISGNNLLAHVNGYPRGVNQDVFLSTIFHCWGWGTWRERWQIYDDRIEFDDEFLSSVLPRILGSSGVTKFWRSVAAGLRENRVSSWAWRMQLSLLRAGMRCLTPPVNLSTNIGFGEDSTHTKAVPFWASTIRMDDDANTGNFVNPVSDPSFDDFEDANILGVTMTRSLDLGCGESPRNVYSADHLYGVDLFDNPEKNILAIDLNISPLPFDNGSFDFVTAVNILGNIAPLLYLPRRRYPLIELFNEVYRVLKVDGLFLTLCPLSPTANVFDSGFTVSFFSKDTIRQNFIGKHCLSRNIGFRGHFSIFEESIIADSLLMVLKKSG